MNEISKIRTPIGRYKKALFSIQISTNLVLTCMKINTLTHQKQAAPTTKNKLHGGPLGGGVPGPSEARGRGYNTARRDILPTHRRQLMKKCEELSSNLGPKDFNYLGRDFINYQPIISHFHQILRVQQDYQYLSF